MRVVPSDTTAATDGIGKRGIDLHHHRLLTHTSIVRSFVRLRRIVRSSSTATATAAGDGERTARSVLHLPRQAAQHCIRAGERERLTRYYEGDGIEGNWRH